MRHYLLLPFILLLLLSGFFASRLYAPAIDNTQTGLSFGAFDVPSLSGNASFSSSALAGHVSVVNIFASWCVPCTVEHPTLMKLSKHTKLYGLAWKDTPANIQAYLKKHGNPYAIIGVDTAGKSTTAIGLSGVPETFVLDKNGVIRYHYKSVITEEIMNNDILPLIEKLNAPAL